MKVIVVCEECFEVMDEIKIGFKCPKCKNEWWIDG